MISCKTCQFQNDPEIDQYLDIEYTPPLVAFKSTNPELAKILNMQFTFYSKYMIILVQAKETGAWIQPYLNEEIEIVQQYIDWLQYLIKGLKNKNE